MRANKVSAIMENEFEGTGLGELTAKRPLATLYFDCKYRMIDFGLSNLVNANVRSIYMTASERNTQSIFDHLGGGNHWHLNNILSHYFVSFKETIQRAQAAGEPFHEPMIDFLRKAKSKFTVYTGNKILCNVDYRSVISVHEEQQRECTVLFKRVESDKIYPKDHILSFRENQPTLEATVFEELNEDQPFYNLAMNIFVVNTDWLINILEVAQSEGEYACLEELIWKNLKGNEVTTYEYTGYLSNIFDVKSYYEANMDMLDPKKFNSLLYSSQHILTKAKNEVPTYFSPESNVHASQFATGSIIRGTVHHSLISRRTAIEEEATVEHSIVMASGKIGQGATIQYAILDKNVTVEAGVRIIGTKEQPLVIKKGSHVTTDQIGE
ncbi:glucose-1-phosphate adenylyltransferase subunit GlgD [Enterococcus bulliens]